jgi:hypothetical protein
MVALLAAIGRSDRRLLPDKERRSAEDAAGHGVDHAVLQALYGLESCITMAGNLGVIEAHPKEPLS